MGIIDGHVHLYPPEVCQAPSAWAAEAGEAHWALLCTRVRRSGRPVQGFPGVGELLAAMDQAGVERAILLGWYWEKHYNCVAQNRFFAECLARHPDRLSACATFHPIAGVDAVRDELRWAHDHGFCGLGELSPHSQHFQLNNAAWIAALDLAAELNLPVNLHVTEPLSKAYPGRVLTPLSDLVRLARLHPRTTFVLAHWGARLPLDPEHGREIASLRNVFFDTAASPLLYEAEVFRQMVDAVGADRIIFGSDFPLILFPAEETAPAIASFVAQAQRSGLDEFELAELFRGTAERVFRTGLPVRATGKS
jgi:predicted TIM-barrel fold metal-dependent hydrolase